MLYVAENEGKIVGCACVQNLKEKDYPSFEWFNASKNDKAKEIGKICVDSAMRGKGIASALIKFILKEFNGYCFYADVMFSPVRNLNSEKTLLKNGFHFSSIKSVYIKELNLNAVFSLFKNKNQKK